MAARSHCHPTKTARESGARSRIRMEKRWALHAPMPPANRRESGVRMSGSARARPRRSRRRRPAWDSPVGGGLAVGRGAGGRARRRWRRGSGGRRRPDHDDGRAAERRVVSGRGGDERHLPGPGRQRRLARPGSIRGRASGERQPDRGRPDEGGDRAGGLLRAGGHVVDAEGEGRLGRAGRGRHRSIA